MAHSVCPHCNETLALAERLHELTVSLEKEQAQVKLLTEINRRLSGERAVKLTKRWQRIARELRTAGVPIDEDYCTARPIRDRVLEAIRELAMQNVKT